MCAVDGQQGEFSKGPEGRTMMRQGKVLLDNQHWNTYHC